MVAGHGRERKREELKGINEEECGVLDILKEEIFWEFGGRKERKEKGKRKRKRICKRKEF